MSDEERFFAAAYLQHLFQQRDPAYKEMVAERLKRMENGQKVTLEKAVRIHQALEAEGL
jgi:hypothetical protein